jgi:hypothetical protein
MFARRLHVDLVREKLADIDDCTDWKWQEAFLLIILFSLDSPNLGRFMELCRGRRPGDV